MSKALAIRNFFSL